MSEACEGYLDAMRLLITKYFVGCCYVVVCNTTYSLAALEHYYFAALNLGEYVVFVLSVGKTQAFLLYVRDAEVDELDSTPTKNCGDSTSNSSKLTAKSNSNPRSTTVQ